MALVNQIFSKCHKIKLNYFSYITEDGLEREDAGIGDTSYLGTENDNRDDNDFGSYDDDDDIYQNNSNDHDKSIYDDLFSVQHYLAVSQVDKNLFHCMMVTG